MGGPQAYKGFGLAFMIEMLCSGLSGAPCAHADAPPPVGNSAWFAVLAPEHFAGSAHLCQEVAALEAYVRGVPLIEGVTSVTLPGDPERQTLAQRREAGIPLDGGNWRALATLAAELGVEVPAP
jgi:uncharacterized oxidoreductase